jgi:hypothetical protein
LIDARDAPIANELRVAATFARCQYGTSICRRVASSLESRRYASWLGKNYCYVAQAATIGEMVRIDISERVNDFETVQFGIYA